MQVYQHIHSLFPIKKEHLDRWVALFTNTVDEYANGKKALLMKTGAQSVATFKDSKLNNSFNKQL